MTQTERHKPGNKSFLVVFFVILFIFSFWLMFSTFGYDAKTQEILLDSRLWSDFGAHLPLIRSFSLGDNLVRLMHFQPPQSPLFSGEPIRYHFLFYALVGVLERLGLRLDWALNLPSALGFFLMLVLLYAISYKLFTNCWVSFLSVLLALFNGSLSFLYFFQKSPLSLSSLNEIVTNSHFASFGPWDGRLVSAFWSLNIYTNQRHLAPSFALGLLVIYLAFSPIHKDRNKRPTLTRQLTGGLMLGLLWGMLIFTNLAVAGAVGIFLAWFFLIKKEFRLRFLLVLPVLLSCYLLYRFFTLPSGPITFDPGYLVAKPLNLLSFLRYWIYNLGFSVILIPLGLFFSSPKIRWLLALPLLILFLIPNLFRFSPDMINNHKFFNFFLLFGNIFSAYAILCIFKQFNNITIKQLRKLLKFMVSLGLIGSLTLSGFIDFFPILNDYQMTLPDYPASQDVEFFRSNTTPDAVILNSTWLYHPASLAGRRIFNGYSYFTWSYGYDQTAREAVTKLIYQAESHQALCQLCQKNRLDYVELNDHPEPFLTPNWPLWLSLPTVYQSSASGMRVYAVGMICS